MTLHAAAVSPAPEGLSEADGAMITARVSKIWNETGDIRCIELVAENGAGLPATDPGAHVTVHLENGLSRQYSLWNGPEDKDHYLLGVKLEPQSRGGSAAMHQLEVGKAIRIDPPINRFPLLSVSGRSLLVAAGIGITPIVAMAQRLRRDGRDFTLHYFTRSWEQTPFRGLLEKMGNVQFHFGIEPEQLADRITPLLEESGGGHLYHCGPAPFMDCIERTALQFGWDEARVHSERFSAEPMTGPDDGGAFDVELRASGKSVRVETGQTIVQAMEEAGLTPVTSCEQGVCGTCLATVLEGEPEHHDLYLNKAEKESGKLIMPCVSRCRGKRLVLDL